MMCMTLAVQRALKFRSHLSRRFVPLLFCFLAALPVAAQQLSGGLKGQVTDQFGALIIGAVVTARGAGGFSETAVTDKNGVYAFRLLTPGSYAVRVEATGFAAYENTGVTVSAQRARTLDIRLEVTIFDEEVTVDSEPGVSTDPSSNVDALVIRGDDLDSLPDDPAALESTLQVLAGSSPGGAQIQVDGMSGGRLPPKESIREIRINQNLLSAENDAPGGSRIDILTKPGADQFHGSGFMNLSDERLNARNPFAGARAPYRYGLYGGTISGPISKKRSSFFLDFQRRDEDENGIVNARGLDAALNFVPVLSSFVVPRRSTTFSPRFDYQLNANNTLIARYTFTRSSISNLGVGELSLPERAYASAFTQHTLQLTETAVLSPRMLNETRFQFVRDRRRREDLNAAPGIIVQESLLAGGPGVGLAFNDTNRFELQNYTTRTSSNHTIRFGARVRGVHVKDVSGENFNGTYIFAGGDAPLLDASNRIVRGDDGLPVQVPITSLERYRRTLLLQRLGFDAAQVRERGGGPTQFSISGGDLEADVSQLDLGVFFQDQWQLRPNLTLTLGLRYEAQTNLGDRLDFAPRISVAWAPGRGGNTRGGAQSKTVVRLGYGIFYERFGEGNTLQALRYDGIRQQRFIITEPGLLGLFPSVPSAGELTPFVEQQTRTRIADNLRAARTDFYLASFEHQLPRKTSVYATFTEFRSRNTLRRRNINAPQPVASGDQAGGVARPFGDIGEIFQIESSNAYNNHQFITGIRTQLHPALSIYTNYMLTKAENGGEPSTFPANSYDLESEWGRAAFDVRHRFYAGGTVKVPKLNMTLNPLVIAFSHRPFNIITGHDTNGDRLFTDRPAFATADTAPGDLRRTPYGDFDVNPAPGQPLIPRNFGRGPNFFSVNLGISRSFTFGAIGGGARATASSTGAGERLQGAGNNNNPKPSGAQATPARRAEDRYKVTFSIDIQNLFNSANFATPVGNLSSPLFGQATRTLNSSGFDASGGSVTPAFNRRIEAQVRFSF
jgi:hypothetical protein